MIGVGLVTAARGWRQMELLFQQSDSHLNIPLAALPIEGNIDDSHFGFLAAEIILRLTPDEDVLASHTENFGDPSWEDLLEQQCMAVPQTILLRTFWLGLGNEAHDKAMAFDFYSRLPWT